MKKSVARYVATTPKEISPAIRRFCTVLSSQTPVYVDVKPHLMASMGRCYHNVTLVDGEPVFGWLIWELPRAYLTAEHHGIVDINGSLLDVTPPVAGEQRVLFLPDPDTPYLPKRPVNWYFPLSTDPKIARFVQLAARNAWLDREGAYGNAEYQRNDSLACGQLDSYFNRVKVDRRKKRRLHKEERRRRKANR